MSEVSLTERRFTWGVLALLTVLLTVVVIQHRAEANPDGVAYILLAQHALEGRPDLMVSGWWSPLIVWLLIPLLALVPDPLLAGHLVVAVSGLLFAAAAVALFRRTSLPAVARMTGTVVVAMMATAWTAKAISPDLLVAAMFTLGASDLISQRWPTDRSVAIRAGLVLGIAFLAKAIALPAACALVAVVAGMNWLAGSTTRRRLLAHSALTLSAIAAVSMPWIAVLSAKYGRVTIAATAGANHALVRPGAPSIQNHYPSFSTLHHPEEGRVTSWEDPSVFVYDDWSPTADLGHLRHQSRLAANNLIAIADRISGFDALRLGLAATLFAFALMAASSPPENPERWAWSLVPLVCIAGPYLAVYALDERYYWPTYPFVVCGALGLASRIGSRVGAGVVARRSLFGAVAASLMLGTFSWDIPGFTHSVKPGPGLARALVPSNPGMVSHARELADLLAKTGFHGPIAGDTRHALYVAFFLHQPCYGQADAPTPESLIDVGAGVVVTPRGSRLEVALERRIDFERVTDGRGASPSTLPLVAFRVLR